MRRWALEASSPDPFGEYCLFSHISVTYCLRLALHRKNDLRCEAFIVAATTTAPATATVIAPANAASNSFVENAICELPSSDMATITIMGAMANE